NLRRALNLAIDRELIGETILDNRMPLPVGHEWKVFGDMFIDRPGPKYDAEAAKALLAKSTYKGEVLQFPVSNYYADAIQTSQALVSMWKAVGINVALTVVESDAQIDSIRPDILNWSNSAPSPDPASAIWRLWQPSNIDGRGWNWKNAEFVASGQILAN